MLKRELADIARRSQAAEARHEELASALPEATLPLLRQIEAMQAAAAAHSQAWAAAERSLHNRLSAAEAVAAASGDALRKSLLSAHWIVPSELSKQTLTRCSGRGALETVRDYAEPGFRSNFGICRPWEATPGSHWNF